MIGIISFSGVVANISQDFPIKWEWGKILTKLTSFSIYNWFVMVVSWSGARANCQSVHMYWEISLSIGVSLTKILIEDISSASFNSGA